MCYCAFNEVSNLIPIEVHCAFKGDLLPCKKAI